jgi:PPM family protein phosphatase
MTASAVAAGWRTETGRRPANQDAVLVERLPDGRELMAVADGMGGHQAGEVASRRALQVLRAAIVDGADLAGATRAANAAVHAAARENPSWDGMGTTLVALLRSGAEYHLANVGDSRAYRIGQQQVDQITRDHSFVAEALADGRMSEEDALRSLWRNALTRSIGAEPEVEVDLFGPYDATAPHIVVLASDGFHGTVAPDRLHACLAGSADPESLADRLIDEAYGAGSTDNISVVVIRFAAAAEPAATGTPPSAAHADSPGPDAWLAVRPVARSAPRAPGLLLPPPRSISRRDRLRRIAWIVGIALAVKASVVVLLLVHW